MNDPLAATGTLAGNNPKEVVPSLRATPSGVCEAWDMERLLLEIAEQEEAFCERFYEIFFEQRPDVVPLFGVHAIAEREEMMRETLKSLFAWQTHEPWLAENLRAFGRSHREYGVTADMYPSFVDAMLECADDVLGASFDSESGRCLLLALGEITNAMREAGDEATR